MPSAYRASICLLLFGVLCWTNVISMSIADDENGNPSNLFSIFRKFAIIISTRKIYNFIRVKDYALKKKSDNLPILPKT